jgi:undecaprenyl pyrophosphate synthase
MSSIKFEIDISKSRVSAEEGKLFGVSVISTPEAKGHGIKIDRASIESFANATKEKKIKAYYTHDASNEALDSIGLWENFQIVEDGEFTKLTADFIALDAWKEHHKDEYDALFEMAEKAPEAFGVSAEFTIEKIFYNENGEEEKYEGQADKEIYARAIEVDAFSIVAQPAANPTGLFAQKKEEISILSEQIIEFQEQNSQMAVDMKIAKEAVDQYSKEIESKDKEIEALKSEVSKWQLKFANFVADSGHDPVQGSAVEAPKSFEEQLASCSSWKEKHQLIQANMQKLVENWNQ